MKKLASFTLLIFILGFNISCDRDDSSHVLLDKEIRIPFPDYSTTTENTYITSEVYTHLLGFNKNDYSDIDSIFFVACIHIGYLPDSIYLRLYNLTDKKILEGSEIKATADINQFKWIQTDNVIDAFPNKAIDLAIQFKRTGTDNNFVTIREAYLKIKRK
jgi:hypothetical protein